MTDLRKSPMRYSFQKRKYIERMQQEGVLLTSPSVEDMLGFFLSLEEEQVMREQTIDWQQDNLEYDLRTNNLIIDKCEDWAYSQHLYAALCNNYFIKNDLWPLLKEQQWHCSWRHAAGIICDIREEGDYIDWYCTGIKSNEVVTDEEFYSYSKLQQEMYLQSKSSVAESVVTDEIRQDLLTIGWLTFADEDQ